MVDIHARFSRDDFRHHGNNFEVGVSFGHGRDTYEFYRGMNDNRFWQGQNRAMIENGIIPDISFGGEFGHRGGFHHPRHGFGHGRSRFEVRMNQGDDFYRGRYDDSRCFGNDDRFRPGDFGGGYSAYGPDVRYFPQTRDPNNFYRRPMDFDRQYVNRGFGHPDFQNQMGDFRQRYMEDFRERQARQMERAYGRRNQPVINDTGDGAVDDRTTPDRDFEGDLPPTPPGYTKSKWDNLNYSDPKYDAGRLTAAELLPQLNQLGGSKEDRQNLTEQFWRENRNVIERGGLHIVGFDGEKILVNDGSKEYMVDTVISIGDPRDMRPGWECTTNYNRNDFRS